jgi:hypothetical protein
VNLQIVGELIRLRYKLMWAKTRSRNGRIALFFSGYILLILVFILLISGGFGAAFLALRTGKGELVARVLLSVLFLQGLIATLALGFGVNNLFTDVELRRYPTTALERRTVRQFIGIVDPFWAMFLMIELGLAVGFYVIGGYQFWKGVVAVLLFFLNNYLMARLMVEGVDRLMRRSSGAIVLMVIIMGVAFLPSILAQSVAGKASARSAVLYTLSYTPPFAAAAAMAKQGAAAAAGLGLLAVWLAGMLALTVILEKHPQVIRRTEQTKMSWSSPYERVASWFPAADAPFVAFWIRFYVRNVRFRTMYLLTLPLMAFLIFNFSRSSGGNVADDAVFLTALGVLPIAGFMATSRFTVNQYGYVGGGFRRFFLLPTDAAASLRAGSYASMLLGSWMVPAAVIAFALFAPVPLDWRRLLMLLASGTAGLFLFHGLGLWVTLFNPRRGDYKNNFGNDLSLGGNIVLIGGIFASLFLPKLLRKTAPALVAPGNWWLSLAAPLAAAAFFWFSLRAAGPIFRDRREQLLAVAEGRD